MRHTVRASQEGNSGMGSPPARICLLGLDPRNSNLGLRALTAGSIACILHRYPGAEISILDYAKEGGVVSFRVGHADVPVQLVNIRFSKGLFAKNHIARLLAEATLLKLVPTKRLRRVFIRRNPSLQHMYDADLVASISGGDSFSDIYGLKRLIYVSLPQTLALCAGKRLILLPQTLGPFRSRFSQTIAKYIMKRAEVVYARDHVGAKLGSEMLGANSDSGKFRFCFDVGFVVAAREPAHLDSVGLPPECRNGNSLVGLNVSGLLFNGNHQWTNAFGLAVEYKTFVHNLIEFLIVRKQASVMLIPHILWPGGEGDPPACEAVYETLKDKFPGKIGLIRATYNQYDQSEIKFIIGQCDFFLGSRMHACIAAVSQNVPAVSIAYSDKFIGVMETLGVEGLVADARKMDQEEILELVSKTYEQRAQIRKQLECKMPQVRQTVLNLFDDLSGLTREPRIGGESATLQSESEILHSVLTHSE